MKIKILKTGKIEEYATGFAVRLIEQGKAVPAPQETKAEAKATKAGEKE
ncbi:MAG: hypothetical protein IJ188_06420 [Clostridia bacterium]|nr:hypothetical protein [Clostridia bacterium]